jgi:hypothetical protein
MPNKMLTMLSFPIDNRSVRQKKIPAMQNKKQSAMQKEMLSMTSSERSVISFSIAKSPE